MSKAATARGELAFRSTTMGLSVAEPGRRAAVTRPLDSISSLGGGSSVAASPAHSRRRAAEQPAYAASNMARILSELGEARQVGEGHVN